MALYGGKGGKRNERLTEVVWYIDHSLIMIHNVIMITLTSADSIWFNNVAPSILHVIQQLIKQHFIQHILLLLLLLYFLYQHTTFCCHYGDNETRWWGRNAYAFWVFLNLMCSPAKKACSQFEAFATLTARFKYVSPVISSIRLRSSTWATPP